MYDPHIDLVVKMYFDAVDKYHDKILSSALNWEALSISHPRYEKKIDQTVPLVLFDWK